VAGKSGLAGGINTRRSVSVRVSHVPLRLAAGAFILNSGLSKLGMEHERAKYLHEMATGAYPVLKRVDPQPFSQALGAGEVALGATLLAPFIPSWMAGLALAGFSGSLVGLYVRTPSAHQENSLRPNDQGVALAKDTWLAGMAAALILDELAEARELLETQRASLEEAQAEAREAAKRARRAEGTGIAGQVREEARWAGKTAKKAAKGAKKGASAGADLAKVASRVAPESAVGRLGKVARLAT
jgi:hypothetical protein